MFLIPFIFCIDVYTKASARLRWLWTYGCRDTSCVCKWQMSKTNEKMPENSFEAKRLVVASCGALSDYLKRWKKPDAQNYEYFMKPFKTLFNLRTRASVIGSWSMFAKWSGSRIQLWYCAAMMSLAGRICLLSNTLRRCTRAFDVWRQNMIFVNLKMDHLKCLMKCKKYYHQINISTPCTASSWKKVWEERLENPQRSTNLHWIFIVRIEVEEYYLH